MAPATSWYQSDGLGPVGLGPIPDTLGRLGPSWLGGCPALGKGKRPQPLVGIKQWSRPRMAGRVAHGNRPPLVGISHSTVELPVK